MLEFCTLSLLRTLVLKHWNVLETDFGPGKSWKLQLKVLEIPEIYLWFKLRNMHIPLSFSICFLNFEIFREQFFSTYDGRFVTDCTVTLYIYTA